MKFPRESTSCPLLRHHPDFFGTEHQGLKTWLEATTTICLLVCTVLGNFGPKRLNKQRL